MTTELKIDTIEQYYDQILELTGSDSYVEWETFTKSSTDLVKGIEELGRAISILREIQQRSFIITMKKLKGLDVPDLIKTVKAKKLPKEALKSILNKFTLTDNKIALVESVESLKEQATSAFSGYITDVNENALKFQELTEYVNNKIKSSGLYQEPQEPKELVSTVKFQISEEKIQNIASNVQIQYLHGTHDLVSMKTYAQIVEGSFELIKPQFKKITDEARKKQRELTKDSKKYLDSLVEYLLNTEALTIEGQKLIANKVGITSKKLEESEIALMERGMAQNVMMLQSNLRAKIKESLPTDKDVSLQEAKEIIKFQIDLINDKHDYLRSVFGELAKNQESMQMIPMLLALILNDMVVEKYTYEEEDFMKNVGENVIQTNPEIGQIFQKMQVAIIRLMQRLDIIPENVGNMMELSAQQRGFEPPQTPQIQSGNGFQGGLMPGSNPMDLLQMQQLQQFQQMQAAQNNKK